MTAMTAYLKQLELEDPIGISVHVQSKKNATKDELLLFAAKMLCAEMTSDPIKLFEELTQKYSVVCGKNAALTRALKILQMSRLNGTGPYDAHRIIDNALLPDDQMFVPYLPSVITVEDNK